MNPLATLGIDVDDIVDRHDGRTLYTGHDDAGRHYLAVEVGGTPSTRSFMLAPISPLALRCVLSGQADPRDAFRHSFTGSVEVVNVDQKGPRRGSVLLCTDLADDFLPVQRERLACVA